MDNYEAENRELLDRFAAALRDRDTSAWFDEDELLDIFDFAGDYGMDYLRAEALFWGVRNFPDSRALMERRAVFYADVLGTEAVNSFSDDHADVDTLLARILSARATITGHDEALTFIRESIAASHNMEDEEVIQLVNFAADTGNLQWMADNTEKIFASLSYKPAFLYELGAAAIQKGEYAMALKALDDLVTEMPYNAEYWSLISTCHLRLNHLDEAADAAEMAIAIDPANTEALNCKARCMAVLNEEELIRMAGEYPDNLVIVETLIDCFCTRMLHDARVRQVILDAITDRLETWQDSVIVQTAAVMLKPDEAPERLDRIWAFEEDNPQTLPEKIRLWTQWAHSVYIRGSLAGAAAIVDTVYGNVPGSASGVTSADISPLIALGTAIHLGLKRYTSVVEDVEMLLGVNGGLSPAVHAAYLTALVRLRRFSTACRHIDLFRNRLVTCMQYEQFVAQGVYDSVNLALGISWLRRVFDDLRPRIAPDACQSFDSDSYDPFENV